MASRLLEKISQDPMSPLFGKGPESAIGGFFRHKTVLDGKGTFTTKAGLDLLGQTEIEWHIMNLCNHYLSQHNLPTRYGGVFSQEEFIDVLLKNENLATTLLKDPLILSRIAMPSTYYNYEEEDEGELGDHAVPVDPNQNTASTSLIDVLQNPMQHGLEALSQKMASEMIISDQKTYLHTAASYMVPNISKTIVQDGKRHTRFSSPSMTIEGDDAENNSFFVGKIKEIASRNLGGSITMPVGVFKEGSSEGHQVAVTLMVDKNGKIAKIVFTNSQRSTGQLGSFRRYFLPILKNLSGGEMLSGTLGRAVSEFVEEQDQQQSLSSDKIRDLSDRLEGGGVICDATAKIDRLKIQSKKSSMCMRFADWNADLLFWCTSSPKGGMSFKKILGQLKNALKLVIYNIKTAANTMASAKSVVFYNQKIMSYAQSENKNLSLDEHGEVLKKHITEMLKSAGIKTTINVKITQDKSGELSLFMESTASKINNETLKKVNEAFDRASSILISSNRSIKLACKTIDTGLGDNFYEQGYNNMLLNFFAEQMAAEAKVFKTVLQKKKKSIRSSKQGDKKNQPEKNAPPTRVVSTKINTTYHTGKGREEQMAESKGATKKSSAQQEDKWANRLQKQPRRNAEMRI